MAPLLRLLLKRRTAIFAVLLTAVGARKSRSETDLPNLKSRYRSTKVGGQLLRFPFGSKVINVKEYGAKGDGATDDTAAILNAIKYVSKFSRPHPWLSTIVYFPTGIYIVSDTLQRVDEDGKFQPHLCLIGDGPERSIIKLRENSLGYGDRTQPKAVIRTTSGLIFTRTGVTEGGRDYLRLGEGNEGFGNIVEGITVSVEPGNPGAIGIDFLGNNIAAIRNVDIVSSDGHCGISMDRKWCGPALVRDVTISNFCTGFSISNSQYSVTINNLKIAGSSVRGLANRGNVLSVKNLFIQIIAGIGIENDGVGAMIVGSNFAITGRGEDAISNSGFMEVDRIDKQGTWSPYKRSETQSHNVGRVPAAIRWSDTVPAFIDPPQPEDNGDWVSVTQYGAKSDLSFDSTAAFQSALSSGAKFVHIPSGTYKISSTLEISNSIEVVDGLFSTINVPGPLQYIFKTREDRTGPLWITRLGVETTNNVAYIIDHSAKHHLYISDVAGGAGLFRRTSEGGVVVTENTAAQSISIAGDAPVSLCQFNTEGRGVRIVNDGAPLFIHGFKTEDINTVLINMNGASSEIMGGFLYRVRRGEYQQPAFINLNSTLKSCYAEEAFALNAAYETHLISQVANTVKVVLRGDLLPRNNFGKIFYGQY